MAQHIPGQVPLPVKQKIDMAVRLSDNITLAEAKELCKNGQVIFIDSEKIYILEEKDVKKYDAYKQRLKDHILSLMSRAEDDKPSMFSLAAYIRNEVLRDLYHDIDEDRI